IVKIKFRNPNCESSWGFVFALQKSCTAAAAHDRSAAAASTPRQCLGCGLPLLEQALPPLAYTLGLEDRHH
ncbi:hypothetical protein, partial [Pseudomonas protegens]|uniref:hypothetical protein n=1 Tax=Pseudomonas protegens TaxID=380021 RepID=UPI0019D7040F